MISLPLKVWVCHRTYVFDDLVNLLHVPSGRCKWKRGGDICFWDDKPCDAHPAMLVDKSSMPRLERIEDKEIIDYCCVECPDPSTMNDADCCQCKLNLHEAAKRQLEADQRQLDEWLK